MKLVKIQPGFHTVTLEMDERDLSRVEQGIGLLMDRYPNSDPIIDLMFALRKISEEVGKR